VRLIIQRVKKAKVSAAGRTVGEIGPGLFVLVGVGEGDRVESADALAHKLAKLRIMSDQEGKMNLSVKDAGGEVLAVSQFTLYADTSAGNRPSFVKAAPPDLARPLYERLVEELGKEGLKVATGSAPG